MTLHYVWNPHLSLSYRNPSLLSPCLFKFCLLVILVNLAESYQAVFFSFPQSMGERVVKSNQWARVRWLGKYKSAKTKTQQSKRKTGKQHTNIRLGKIGYQQYWALMSLHIQCNMMLRSFCTKIYFLNDYPII